MNRLFWPIWGLLFSLLAFGQSAKAADSATQIGLPYIQNYTPKEYGGQITNWTIVQDPRGVMYFGNDAGVLEYDGVTWRLIPTQNRTIVRSLDIDSTGVIYVGAEGEFGYLAADAAGQLRFVSLVDSVPEKYRIFGDVWQTLVTSRGVYFRTTEYLFCWTGHAIKVWAPKHSFHTAFVINDSLYVRQWDVGLMVMRGESLELLPEGEKFADERVYIMLPYDDGISIKPKLLIGGRSMGLQLFDGQHVTPFQTDIDAQLLDAQLYHAARLSDGSIAIATLRRGIILIDRNGRFRQGFDKSSGLQDENVKYVYADRQGGLWAALNNGLSRIKLVSEISIFDERAGLGGTPNTLCRFNGRLYAGTSRGLYYLAEPDSTGQARFVQLPDIASECHDLKPAFDRLLAATNDGVYEISDARAHLLTSPEHSKSLERYSLCLLQSRVTPQNIYAGLRDGLVCLRYNPARSDSPWTDLGKVADFSIRIESLGETADGRLWLGTRYQGLISVHFFSGYDIAPRTIFYGVADGLPQGEIVVTTLAGRTVFAARDGLYHFDETTQTIRPNETLCESSNQTDDGKKRRVGSVRQSLPGQRKRQLLKIPESAAGAIQLAEDAVGNVWLRSDKALGQAVRQDDSAYVWQPRQLLRVSDSNIKVIYPEGAGLVWFGMPEGLALYNPAKADTGAVTLQTILRQVVARGDSMIYGGTGLLPHELTLGYDVNGLRFSFALPGFDQETANRYQYRLENFDKGWSSWTAETRREYTNLPEGAYRFQVRGRNVYGNVGAPHEFAFEILPPWYRTWWAYSLYLITVGLVFAGGVFGYAHYQAKKQAVQMTAKEAELQKQRDEADRLQSLNEKMQQLDKLKDEFLANTSHELRTPLNGIIGLAESLIDGVAGPLNKVAVENLRMVISSGRRLSTLVNDILDFSKLKNQELILQQKPVDMGQITGMVLTLCKTLASGKPIVLINKISPDAPAVYGDENRIQQIMYNLIGNAIKFTESGSVTVSATVEPVPVEAQSLAAFLTITVADTGIGIPADKFDKIFQSFEQADGSTARTYGGTGLGLAVTKKLVELHGGRVWLESEVGKGSIFHFTLPISVEQLSTEEREAVAALRRDESVIEMSAPLATLRREDFVADDADSELFVEGRRPVNGNGDNDHHKYRILVVDDEPVNIQVVSNMLTIQHYHVAAALNGLEALAYFKKGEKFDLVLLDVMMPRMSGYEVCEKIRQIHPATTMPIILLTAKNQVSDLVTGFNSGANDYLTKPFSKNELMARIRTHLTLARLNTASTRFVPREFLNFLDKESLAEVKLGDQVQREMTVLFSDIRSFTTLSEKMTPEQNFRFINDYLSRMEPAINDHRGFIDKYIGDAIMALFGGTADDGVQAAIGMMNNLEEYNRQRAGEGEEDIHIGIGLNTGMLMLGTVGGSNRMDGTVISDAVNLSSRIEGMTKMYGVAILISDNTYRHLKDPTVYGTRVIDKVKVKGKTEPVVVYEVFEGDPADIRKIKYDTKMMFEEGWGLYQTGDFSEALLLFKRCLNRHPGDGAARLFVDRCEQMQAAGKPTNWDGVMALTSK